MKKTFYLSLLLGCLCMVGCKDDSTDSGQPYDPNRPATFTEFTPTEGAVRTRMYIKGSNFGTDESKIHVNIGGKRAKVIGSDGNTIYCMVPSRAYSGEVVVMMEGEKGDTAQTYTFDQKFTYNTRTVVGTLLRKVDENNESGFSDGSFDGEASVPSNDWLVFDPKPQNGGDKLLFSSNYYDGLRVLNLTQRTVTRLFPRSQYKSMHSFTFSVDGDTLFFPDDNGQATSSQLANIYYALRSENFRKIRPYNYAPCSYAMVCMPDGYKFYCCWKNAAVYRMGDNSGGIPHVDNDRVLCFKLDQLVATGGEQTVMILHPSGKYMYMFSKKRGAILRSNYNPTTHMFEGLTIIAGSLTQRGAQEGIGSTARFHTTWAGVFVKNREYVNNPRPDGELYDFYFTDSGNHCIWKLTPDGVARIAVGRSNYTADHQYSGYVDGDPLKEARLHRPCGLAYDPSDEIWYIGDNNNRGIRYVATE